MKKIINSLFLIIIVMFSININVYALDYQECYNYKITISGNGEKTSGIPNNIFKCSDSQNIIANASKQCYKTKLFDSNYYLYDVVLQKKGNSSYMSVGSENKKYDNCETKSVDSCIVVNDKSLCKVLSDNCNWLNNGCANKLSSSAVNKTTDQTICDKYNTAAGGYLPSSGNIAGVARNGCKADGCFIENNNKCKAYSTSGALPNQNGGVSYTAHVEGNTVETSCNGIFGDFQDDLFDILKIFEIIAPIIVAAFTVYEYLVAVINKDADALKKCNSRLVKRLILMAVLFLLPALVNVLLKLVGDNYGVCIKE